MTLKGAHIQAVGLSHSYKRGQTRALDDINLEIQPGEAVAFVGRSGCGKSTLLHILCGLSRPTEGKVCIDGRTVTGPNPAWVMMFQAPSLFPWMTVEQNVSLGLRFNNRMSEAKRRVPELLDLVELRDFAKRNVQDLSGGQQQRVALARSLMLNPDVLLLDEPLSALDAFTRHSLQRDIRRIADEMGITLIIVTHDINEAVMMADRAFVMEANPGRIFAEIKNPIEGDRVPSSTQFGDVRAALVAAYEQAAGLEMADALNHTQTGPVVPQNPLPLKAVNE